jgi:ABC-type transport system involved in multi-copper enzyme maturation permease subunit
MNTLFAMLGDTWRQAKQQIVFPLVMVLMALFAIVWPMLVAVMPTPDGEYVLAPFYLDEAPVGFDAGWDMECERVLVGDKRQEATRGPRSEAQKAAAEAQQAAERLAVARVQKESEDVDQRLSKDLKEAEQRFNEKKKALRVVEKQVDEEIRAVVEQRSPGLSRVHKGVQVWLSWGVYGLVYLSILGFIAAGSGFFPAMLASGAIDLIISKPVRRYEIFFAKYFSGLVLMSAALLAALTLMFGMMGLRVGIWHLRVFAAMPVLVFIIALIYAVVLCVGVVTRSTPLAIVIGFAYYTVVELFVWGLQQIGTQAWAPLARTGEIMRWTFPGFGRLNAAAGAAVWKLPILDWQPLIVGSVWLVVLLAAAYLWFERTDF